MTERDGKDRSFSPASRSSGASSGWFAVLQENLMQQSASQSFDDECQESKEGKDNIGDAVMATTVLDDGTSTVSSLGMRRFDQTFRAERVSHDNEVCDPCVFITTIRGCPKGARCRYCHFSHENFGEKAKTTHRPRKQTRDKFKADVQELLQASEGRLEQIHDELQAEARKSTYVRKLLQGYLDVEFDSQLSFPEAPHHFVPVRLPEASERMPGMPRIPCDASSPPGRPGHHQASTATTLGLLMENPEATPAPNASDGQHSWNVGSMPSNPPPTAPPQVVGAPAPLPAPPSHAPNLITSEPHSPICGPPESPPGLLETHQPIDQVEVLNFLMSR